jgi:hypothetical protein
MEDKNKDRFIDDLIFPRKKTLTDLWREEWEREFNLSEKGRRKSRLDLKSVLGFRIYLFKIR